MPTEVVAEWPAGTFLENLACDPDGRSWLVTSPTDCAVYRSYLPVDFFGQTEGEAQASMLGF